MSLRNLRSRLIARHPLGEATFAPFLYEYLTVMCLDATIGDVSPPSALAEGCEDRHAASRLAKTNL